MKLIQIIPKDFDKWNMASIYGESLNASSNHDIYQGYLSRKTNGGFGAFSDLHREKSVR